MKVMEKIRENKLLKIIKPLICFTLWVFIYAFILFFFTYSIQSLSNVPSTITPSKLGLSIYNLSGNDLPWYMMPFNELYEEYLVFNNNIVYNNDGEVISKEELKNRELVQKCGILQYEMLIKRKNFK